MSLPNWNTTENPCQGSISVSEAQMTQSEHRKALLSFGFSCPHLLAGQIILKSKSCYIWEIQLLNNWRCHFNLCAAAVVMDGVHRHLLTTTGDHAPRIRSVIDLFSCRWCFPLQAAAWSWFVFISNFYISIDLGWRKQKGELKLGLQICPLLCLPRTRELWERV